MRMKRGECAVTKIFKKASNCIKKFIQFNLRVYIVKTIKSLYLKYFRIFLSYCILEKERVISELIKSMK